MFTVVGAGRQVSSVVKQLQTISFKDDALEMTDTAHERFQLPYDEIVMAYIEVCDEATGELRRLELADITEDTDGEVILCDCKDQRFRIKTEQTGKKAGYIMKQLALHAPYILMDSQEWLEEDNSEEFAEAERMVSIMRELPDKKVRWIPFKYL